MTIEGNKRYIMLRMICGNLYISLIQTISRLNLSHTYATLAFLKIQEDGSMMVDYTFIDTRYIRPLNEHCLRMGSGFYIVDSKQMALQSLYHLIKKRFNVGETRTPFLQNLSCNLDREHIQECSKTSLSR